MVILSGCVKANPTLGLKSMTLFPIRQLMLTSSSLRLSAVDLVIRHLSISLNSPQVYFLQATLHNNYIVSIYGIYHWNQVYIRQLM